MRQTVFRVLAIVAVLAVVASSLAITASAFDLQVGMEYDGIGTVVTNENEKSVGGVDGFDYNKTTYKNAKNKGQTLYAMEFNPKTTGLVTLAYQPKPSYGYTVAKAIEEAKKEGYDVLGGINGEFFSMASGNYGTLEGRLITNGRIVEDSEDRDDVCLTIDSEGNFGLVKSKMAYRLYVNGNEVLNAASGGPIIGSINKRYNGTNWWSPLMYFDYETGGKTYSNADVVGIEVVFDKLEGTELIVEGMLQGKVVSKKEDTYGTAMTENQFVLYAQKDSANYNVLKGLEVGQEVQIFADELNADAEQAMKNAMSVSTATYPIVVDGVDNTDYTPNATDIYMTRAQRTAIGVKADGTMVFLCVAGRGTSDAYTYGITLPELAKMMISLGCVQAVNLDGGGSSTFCVDGETKFVTDGGRAVASSILICKRNDKITSSAKRDELTALIAQAESGEYSGAQAEKVAAAVAEAKAVCDDTDAKTGSVNGDFIREMMDMKAAMGLIEMNEPNTGLSLDAAAWSYDPTIMKAANDDSGALILNNTNGQWPWANYSCNVDVPVDAVLYYDVQANGQLSIQLILDGQPVIINEKIDPAHLDPGSGDIVASGNRYKGSIKMSEYLPNGGNLSAVSICAIGGAGEGSKVIVRHLDFTAPNGEDGGDDDTTTTVPGDDTTTTVPGDDTTTTVPGDTTTTVTGDTTTTTVAGNTTTSIPLSTTIVPYTPDGPKTDSPNTGDAGQAMLYVTAIVAALAAIVFAKLSAKKTA